MLSASAYSFRQKSRLAISLSWVAGYTNVITFIACAVVISHATGNVTHFGKAVADQWIRGRTSDATREAFYFGGLVASFLMGAVVSAGMTEGARRAGFRSKYSLPMALQALLLCLLAVALAWHYLPDYALIAPIAFLLWIILVDWRKPIADVRELDLLSDPDHRGYDDLRSLLPPELGIYRLVHHRRDAVHHAPDFQQWVE